MINLIINYQGRKVPISIDIKGAIQYDDLASLVAEKLTINFSKFMKKVHNTELTERSKQKYFLSQYIMLKYKLQEMRP